MVGTYFGINGNSLAPDCSRLQFSPNIQSGKYNEMGPILIGTAVSKVSYTDFIALIPSWQTFVRRGERNKVSVRDYKTQGENKKFCQHPRWRTEIYPKML